MSTTSTYRPNIGAASFVSINPENRKLRKKFVASIPGIPCFQKERCYDIPTEMEERFSIFLLSKAMDVLEEY